MMTVVDQVRPWLMPSRTLANTTQPQVGAQMRIRGTGIAISHPARSTGLRPYRSDRVPAKKLVTALTRPKAAMNESPPTRAVSPNTRWASSGTTVRSWPRVAPTRALTATSSMNWPRLVRIPSRNSAAAGVAVPLEVLTG